ncbi:MAG: AAA domain-containing protein [Nannocystaceae bacterium]
MKALFFHAVAGHPKVASPLMSQARTTLRPFQQYLRQAIHTAKQRQFQYQLPWQRVRNVVTIRLEPLDTVLRVPRPPPDLQLADWPADVAPDLGKSGFVINRSLAVQVESARLTSSGLRVRTNPALEPQDRLVWCGVECAVEQQPVPGPPRTIAVVGGRPLPLLGPPEADGEQSWRIRVEGRVQGHDGEIRIELDGEEVHVQLDREQPRRVSDASGRSFDVAGGIVRTEDPPVEGPLRGNDGIRYAWRVEDSSGRRGHWVQLLPPTAEADEFLDARAAFCEGDVREVWTQARHHTSTVFRVKRVDAERYQLLLERLPPQGSTLYLPVDIRNLHLQRRALDQLAGAPLPHHQGLLRLCEDPGHVRWPRPSSVALESGQWRSLTDPTRDGTDEQRRFVAKALGSPDFAFLEGPPGSGKTTAICELIQQLIAEGQRVLLCASTHVAIDNVLERLLDTPSPIDAVRIGRLERVDDKVQRTQLDTRIDTLLEAWHQRPAMRTTGDQELREMAERTIIMAANLTCGTTMGIVNHPLFQGRDEDIHPGARPITTMPHWDVLIVDEASKTLIQEFMVPALMARRWVIVGDVRQLPPFADRADIVANLRDLVDDQNRPLFPRDHQRACLLLFRLLRSQVRQPKMRWLVVEPPGVLSFLEQELRAEPVKALSVVRIVERPRASHGPVQLVSPEQLRSGKPEALYLAAASWVLVAEDLLPRVSGYLPSSLLLTRQLGGNDTGLPDREALLFRQGHWLTRAGRVPELYRDERPRRDQVRTLEDAQECETDWLARHDLAPELAWRLTRIHELRHSHGQRERDRLRRDLDGLRPYAVDISEPLAELEDIGLPSILEVLQEGIGEERSQRRSALTLGFRASQPADFAARFESLSFQHRMHPTISEFPRDVIYQGQALRDANTVAQRDGTIDWDFGDFRARRTWCHVSGHDHQGVNATEVEAVEELVLDFIEWAKSKGPPNRSNPCRWEVACLAFYVKQERALSQMLQKITGDERTTRLEVPDAPVEIVCGTVDRFQGREADLVLLSMRNARRIGFLDSPNRLNVATTRARQQLVVVGNADYFGRCRISELRELVRSSPMTSARSSRARRRRTR